jgi:UDP-glucose:(heptosyl)LPS alpha-1,3-glucosyltransferase
MKKKIAIIIERMDTALGGAERSISELAEALSQRGMEVSIIATTGQMNSPNTHILFPAKSVKRTSYSAFAKALKKYLTKNTYDIVHSVLPFDFADIYQPRGGSYTEAAVRNAASYENKLLASFKKATAFMNLRRTALLHAEQRLCENLNGPVIAALSDYVARQFKEHYRIDPQRIMVIRNGVKTDRLIDKARVDALRKQIFGQLKVNESNNYTLLLFVANNFRLKGLGCLIKAIAVAANNKTLLMVVGRDNISAYRNMAKQLGIDNKIIFLSQVGDIQNVIAASDAVVLPTYYDPSSRVILEALAAGKPVITTRFNGAMDLFTHSRHGIVIDSPENIATLAQAINYFAQPENARKASDAIIADNLKEKISISRVAREMEALYNTIIERRRNK